MLRRTVRRVIVDVVVTDAQGRPVSGLQSSDFHVFEDSHEQKIRNFDVHTTGHIAATLPPAPALPARTFMNYPAVPQNAPLTVILYDVVNTPLVAQSYAHAALVKFLKDSPVRNETAVFVLSDHLHLLQGFTADTGRLLEAVNSKGGAMRSSTYLQSTNEVEQNAGAVNNITPNSQVGAAGAPNQIATQSPSAGQMDIVQALTNIEALESAVLLDRRVDVTLEGLDEIARFLAGTPGRKNLIWLSGSYPVDLVPDLSSYNSNDAMRINLDRIIGTNDLLNASQVAVYALDVRGLMVNPMYQASSGRKFAPGGSGRKGQASVPAEVKAVQDFENSQAAEHASMKQISDQTGGRAFFNSNGLDQAIETALDEGNNYYSLTYAPTNPHYDGTLRHIRVSIDRAGDHLAYRQGYFADDLDPDKDKSANPAPVRLEPGSLASAMQFGTPSSHELIFVAHVDAVGSPVPATAKQMDDLMPYLQAASRINGKKFVPPKTPTILQQYAVHYAVLAKQLDLAAGDDNISRPKLTFAELAFDSNGYALTGLQTTIEDAIPATRLTAIQRDGYRIVQNILIPVNASVLRVGVQDGRINRMGSMEIELLLSSTSQAGTAVPPH